MCSSLLSEDAAQIIYGRRWRANCDGGTWHWGRAAAASQLKVETVLRNAGRFDGIAVLVSGNQGNVYGRSSLLVAVSESCA